MDPETRALLQSFATRLEKMEVWMARMDLHLIQLIQLMVEQEAHILSLRAGIATAISQEHMSSGEALDLLAEQHSLQLPISRTKLESLLREANEAVQRAMGQKPQE